MPSAEDCVAAQNDVRQRCIDKYIREGHPPKSAREIVAHMSYQEQADKIGQQTGIPYSAY